MMKQEQKMDWLGRIGEKIIVNYLSRQGLTVEESINPYDSEKDLVCAGKNIEVKTQVPFIIENAFTFKPNQLKKCRSVDELYFVAVPAPKHSYKWAGWIFKVDPKEFLIRKRIVSGGREMILVNIQQDAVVPIEKVSDEYMTEMVKYTISKY
jgi:hypothetical protein